MLDPKKLLDDLLGSKVPGGSGSTVRDGASKVTQLAKDNPLATGAIAAVLLGTGAGRALTGTALKAGGLAAGDRAGDAGGTRLSRHAGRPPETAGSAGRPRRGDGFRRQGVNPQIFPITGPRGG